MTTLRIRRSLLAVALLAGAACGRITAEPGGDFGVRLVGPASLTLVGKLSAPVRFAVSGCDAFDVAIQNGASTGGVAAARQDDGTWLADVPVEWLRTDDHDCLHDALRPLEGQAELVVTCRDVARSVSVDLVVIYATATRAYDAKSRGFMPVSATRYVFPGPDPLLPYALVPSFVEPFAGLFPVWATLPLANGGVSLEAGPLAEPRLVADGRSVFYPAGCVYLQGCPDIPVTGTQIVPSEAVHALALVTGAADGHAFVPLHVLDMAWAPDGTLVVLSQPFPGPSTTTASVLSTLTWAPGATVGTASVIAYFPAEWVQTRFATTADGRLAWLAWVIPAGSGLGEPIQSVLRTTDGHVVDARPDPTGTEYLGEVFAPGDIITSTHGQLSPDGSEIMVSGSKLIGPDGTVTQLPTSVLYPGDGDTGDTVWLAGGIALWEGSSWFWGTPGSPGAVEVFDASPPHARRFGYDVQPMPGSGGTARLYGAVAVGDKLVLTTSTGIRVLGPDGALVGGADPLPCGLSTTSRATRVGPSTVAVGAGDYLYVFDL